MKVAFRKDTRRGAAWLSSARVVRCWVKSRNERNPCLLLPSGQAGHSEETAGDKPEEAGLSSDCRLQLACMKLESLVIADQHAAVNTFPGLVHTARHITKAGCTRSRRANPQGRQAPKVWLVIGVKS